LPIIPIFDTVGYPGNVPVGIHAHT
jgi:hypothetical protein